MPMSMKNAADSKQTSPSPGKREGPASSLAMITKTVVVLGFGLAAFALAFAYANLISHSSSEESDDLSVEAPSPSSSGIPSAAGSYAIVTPRTYAVDQVSLADYEEVLGISAGNKCRAYLVRAMNGQPNVHVVDDLLDGIPVSIAHCDRTRCTKVFSGDKKGTILRLSYGGFVNDQMLIHVNGVNYYQESLQPVIRNQAEFPLQEFKFEETTWKKWKTAHPDTDIYVGDFSALRNDP
jgi:Protein of unknown function (DUF3179)